MRGVILSTMSLSLLAFAAVWRACNIHDGLHSMPSGVSWQLEPLPPLRMPSSPDSLAGWGVRLLRRNPFRESRTSFVEVTPETSEPPAVIQMSVDPPPEPFRAPLPRLRGILGNGDAWDAIVLNPDVARDVVVRPGEYVGIFEVVAVSAAGVLLQGPDSGLRLVLPSNDP